MEIRTQDLNSAVRAGLISTEQAHQLWVFWKKEQADGVQFSFSHLFYYFGGILAMTAVAIFLTESWNPLQGWPLCMIGGVLFSLGIYLTHYFLKCALNIPASIIVTFSLALVPLVVYHLQVWIGWLPTGIVGLGFPSEMITLLVSLILLYFYRFPFLLMPISIILWYMSLDFSTTHFAKYITTDTTLFSIYFGLLISLIAVYVDFRRSEQRQDFAFWLYLAGIFIFWCGLTIYSESNELRQLMYGGINLVMLLISVLLNRRLFVIFGTIGLLIYIGHLAFAVFKESLLFPFSLVLLGFCIIFFAAYWEQIEKKLINCFYPYFPKKILQRIAARQLSRDR